METKRKKTKPLVAIVNEDRYMSGQVTCAIVSKIQEDRGIESGKQLVLVTSDDPKVIASSVVDIVTIEKVHKLISAKTPYRKEDAVWVGGKQLTEQQTDKLVDSLGYYSTAQIMKYTPVCYLVTWKIKEKEAAV